MGGVIEAHRVEQVRAAEAELMARVPDGTLMQRAAYLRADQRTGHMPYVGVCA